MMSARRFRGLLGLLTVLAASAAPADSPSSLTWHGSTEIARGRGERGPWRQNESRYDFVDDPAVAINSRGEIAIAWVDQARKAVLLQRYSPEGKPQFPRPVDVSRRPQTFSWLPRVAFAPDAPHSVFVLWQEIIFSGGTHGGDILFARSSDGGRSFAGSGQSSHSVGGDGKGRVSRQIWHNGSMDLVAGANGVVHAAWTEYDRPSGSAAPPMAARVSRRRDKSRAAARSARREGRRWRSAPAALSIWPGPSATTRRRTFASPGPRMAVSASASQGGRAQQELFGRSEARSGQRRHRAPGVCRDHRRTF